MVSIWLKNITKVVRSKPIHVGYASLDLSKLAMLQFHYNVIEQHFKTKYTLPYGDNDSFVSNTKHPDNYEWITEKQTTLWFIMLWTRIYAWWWNYKLN